VEPQLKPTVDQYGSLSEDWATLSGQEEKMEKLSSGMLNSLLVKLSST